MVNGYSTTKYGDNELYLTNLTRRKVAGSIKQKVGFNLVKHKVPGITDDWEITANGMIFDTSTAATTARRLFEEDFDLKKRHYTDGLITGSFIMTSVSFAANQNNPMHFLYSLKMIEYNQP